MIVDHRHSPGKNGPCGFTPFRFENISTSEPGRNLEEVPVHEFGRDLEVAGETCNELFKVPHFFVVYTTRARDWLPIDQATRLTENSPFRKPSPWAKKCGEMGVVTSSLMSGS